MVLRDIWLCCHLSRSSSTSYLLRLPWDASFAAQSKYLTPFLTLFTSSLGRRCPIYHSLDYRVSTRRTLLITTHTIPMRQISFHKNARQLFGSVATQLDWNFQQLNYIWECWLFFWSVPGAIEWMFIPGQVIHVTNNYVPGISIRETKGEKVI